MTNDRIFEAAKQGDLTYLQSVISSFDENTCDENGANCLHYAARGGRLDVVEYLIKKRNFSAKKRTRVGATAAHDASATGKTAVLQWLLKQTTCVVNDQDGTGATVTHLAARYGHGRLIEWLMDETDADVMMKSASGALPIHFAVSGGNPDVVNIIVKETPRTVNLQMVNGVTPVYLASQEGHLNILKLLVQKGGSIKMKSFDGMSCLHAATQLGRMDCVKWLIEDQKHNPNDRDFDGATPLHFAASRGHYKVIDWLMKEGGAKVTLDNLGGSPLHNAAELGQLKCVQTLLANGCSADITDNSGLTAADLADKCYHTTCAKEIKAQILENETGIVELERFNSSPSHSPLPSTDPLDPATFSLALPDSDFSGVARNTATHRKTESLEVFFDAESDDDYVSSVDFPHHPDIRFQSEETGECESSVTLSVKSHESSESESLLRRQLSQPDLELSPPHNLPSSEALCQKSDSDVSSLPPRHRSASEYSWNSNSDLSSLRRHGSGSDVSSIASSLSSVSQSASHVSQSASQPEDSVISVSGSSLRSPSLGSFPVTHQEELFKAIRARRMETEVNLSSEDIVIREKTVNGESNGARESYESHRLSDSGLESGAGPNSLSMEKSAQSSTVSSPPSSVTSPIIAGPVKHDLIAELKIAAASGNSNLRKTRKPREEGHMTCIYSFGSNEKVNSQIPNGPKALGQSSERSQVTRNGQHVTDNVTSVSLSNGQVEAKKPQPLQEKSMVIIESKTSSKSVTPPPPTPPPQNPSKANVPPKTSNGVAASKTSNGVAASKTSNGTADQEPTKGADNSIATDPFDPKNFLDKVDPKVPDWRRHMLARKMAESAKKQAEEQTKIEKEENKYKHLPAWKRQLMEKKEADAKVEEAKKLELQASQAKKTTKSIVNTTPAGKLAPWQLEIKTKKS
ncbi:espin-like isoform X3 [Mizuhopecten yessoensis]|uniref:Espin n=1 Tax=Mizuhopecten yessoensis TaxID=6573 RepID=A0A210PTN4_MIZYE|nr:espin-like isoform X3 [Mizuhopecten yessoensis]OWF39848.1 Espin [Mizuhopecten yessoensis]